MPRRQQANLGLYSWIWNCTKPFIFPQNSTQTPARTHLSTTKTVEPRAPKIPLLTAEKRAGGSLNSKEGSILGVFLEPTRTPVRRLGLLECKFGAGRLAAASRYGWRETKLRLALHLALLSEDEEEEDFDNNNDFRGVWYLCSTLKHTDLETRVFLCLETRPLLKSKTHSHSRISSQCVTVGTFFARAACFLRLLRAIFQIDLLLTWA